MPYAPDHKQRTRNKIVRSAARLFNRRGIAEVTIGEIMPDAGLTHGGFYRHFKNKEEFYAEAVRHFLRKEAPARWQKGPAGALKPDQAFAKFVVGAYLSRDHLEDVDGSCPLIGLSSDVARSSRSVKVAPRSLAIRERALGPEHPAVGTAVYNLAALYQDQGRYAEPSPWRGAACGIAAADRGAQ